MKKTFITIVSVLMAAVLAFGFAACAGQKGPKEFDVEALAADIFANCKFDDADLAKSDDSEFTVCKVCNADPALIAGETGAKKCAAYVSASPEMIICIEAVDEAAAHKLMDETFAPLIKSYIEEYTNYSPEEVSKLKDAVKIVDGKYVIVVVCADNAQAETYVNAHPGK